MPRRTARPRRNIHWEYTRSSTHSWWYVLYRARAHPRALGLLRPARRPGPPSDTWARGIEGQRQADLGNGFFLNPIVAGDHPDPSILKDGADYYMRPALYAAGQGEVRFKGFTYRAIR
jgi:hypothetical protein